jgi:serine/threonine protein kinase
VIDTSEFVFETVLEDGETVLSRGRRDAKPSSILVLATLSKYRALKTLSRLEHEYALREKLATDWTARPLALTQYEGRLVLVLEDPGGIPLHQFVGQPMELSQFLRFALGLIAAIGSLHECGLIHKDIKPANILVDSATGGVWLTGFGIASLFRASTRPPSPQRRSLGHLLTWRPNRPAA